MTGSDNNVMKQFDLRDLVNDAISSGKIVRTDGIQIEWAVMKRGVVYGIPYVERDVEREFCEEDMPEERRIPSLPDNCSWIRLDSMVIQAYRNKNSAVEILHEPVKDVSKEKAEATAASGQSAEKPDKRDGVLVDKVIEDAPENTAIKDIGPYFNCSFAASHACDSYTRERCTYGVLCDGLWKTKDEKDVRIEKDLAHIEHSLIVLKSFMMRIKEKQDALDASMRHYYESLWREIQSKHRIADISHPNYPAYPWRPYTGNPVTVTNGCPAAGMVTCTESGTVCQTPVARGVETQGYLHPLPNDVN